ncbi:glycosyltransferase family 4 protein [Spirulina subsalsa]|uniref:glycosyltransferase family 4 protein n=1 Tax=Spirulina subsalsa TaxID=54311 RepID=UPI00030064DE|nr:glycosyltransferase family 4 protein [Spirulina subsalsa]
MQTTDTPIHHVFVFLEIFAQEGGIQSYVKDILEAYQNLTEKPDCPYQADVLLLRDSADSQNPFSGGDLTFHYFLSGMPWLGRLRLAAALLKTLLTQRPHHVFCGHINLAPLIHTLCKPLGIPYTVLTYGKEVWEVLPESKRYALQAAQGIWTISRYSRDRLCKANQIPENQVQFLPCIVDETQFTPGEKPPSLLEKYHLTGCTVLMTVARLWSGDPYKGVDVTIRALPAILKEFPEVKYLIIGRGDDQPRLAQLAQDLGVAERVIFAGFVPTEDLSAHYRVADIYVMPSQEGFGIVYLEAMVSGIPVISGDNDGSADPLQDGRVGWRVPHRDVDSVAQACLEVLRNLNNPAELRCKGSWLREQTIAKFSKGALTQQLKVLIEP